MTNGEPYYPYQPGPGNDQGDQGPGENRRTTRRSRARGFFALGFAAWAVLEIWLLTLLGEAAGGLTVLAVLLAGGVLGTVAIKRAGRRAWNNLTEAMQEAQQTGFPPSPASAEGHNGGNGLAILGGLFLIVPGLVSDVAGLFCLFPPTAGLLRRGTERLLSRGELGEAMRQARESGEQARMRRPDGKVVQGEVLRNDDEPPRS